MIFSSHYRCQTVTQNGTLLCENECVTFIKQREIPKFPDFY